jgi:hypothetical protein
MQFSERLIRLIKTEDKVDAESTSSKESEGVGVFGSTWWERFVNLQSEYGPPIMETRPSLDEGWCVKVGNVVNGDPPTSGSQHHQSLILGNQTRSGMGGSIRQLDDSRVSLSQRKVHLVQENLLFCY